MVRVLQRIMWHDLAVGFVPLRLGGFDSSTDYYGASLCKGCMLYHASCKIYHGMRLASDGVNIQVLQGLARYGKAWVRHTLIIVVGLP